MPAQSALYTLYTLAETAIATLVRGSALVVPVNVIECCVNIYAAPVATTTPGTSGSRPTNRISLQACIAGVDDKWVDIPGCSFSTPTTAAATTTANGSISAAATTVTTVGSGTFGSTSSLLYFKDSTTGGEWVKMQSQATTTVTVPSPGVVNSHSTGISIYDQAQRWCIPNLDVLNLGKLRIEVDNAQQTSGPTIAVYAEALFSLP